MNDIGITRTGRLRHKSLRCFRIIGMYWQVAVYGFPGHGGLSGCYDSRVLKPTALLDETCVTDRRERGRTAEGRGGATGKN